MLYLYLDVKVCPTNHSLTTHGSVFEQAKHRDPAAVKAEQVSINMCSEAAVCASAGLNEMSWACSVVPPCSASHRAGRAVMLL